MPTYGWVREDAIEGFLAGTETISPPVLPPTPQFSCPFCSYLADQVGALHGHISSAHPIDRPCLLLDGRECQSNQIVRRRHSFKIVNASAATISVDGASQREIKPIAIEVYLSGLRQESVAVVLTNAKQKHATAVTSEYRLAFRIAEGVYLREVEHAFLSQIIDQPLSMTAVRNFLDDVRCKGAGADYADGLAKYVTGVLVKERPEGERITSPFERYRELFGLALQSLEPQSRPLSKLVCALIRFALNDTLHVPPRTGYVELDIAARMLAGPNGSAVEVEQLSQTAPRRRVCPVDHGTGRILDLALRMAQQTRWSKTLSEECRQVAESSSLDAADRQKALALWAVTALRLGSANDAVTPLAQISATYPFSTWATPCLERASRA